jgi:hypothetical protein
MMLQAEWVQDSRAVFFSFFRAFLGHGQLAIPQVFEVEV